MTRSLAGTITLCLRGAYIEQLKLFLATALGHSLFIRQPFTLSGMLAEW